MFSQCRQKNNGIEWRESRLVAASFDHMNHVAKPTDTPPNPPVAPEHPVAAEDAEGNDRGKIEAERKIKKTKESTAQALEDAGSCQ
jgi:hypothetical protein